VSEGTYCFSIGKKIKKYSYVVTFLQ
jgi:hypothetical protein